jgi:hypothetical protein
VYAPVCIGNSFMQTYICTAAAAAAAVAAAAVAAAIYTT